MESILSLLFVYTCTLVILLVLNKLYRKFSKTKTFDKILSQKNFFRAPLRDYIFFFIILNLFAFSLSLTYFIQETYDQNLFVKSGLLSTIIIVCIGNMARLIYNGVCNILHKIYKKDMLLYIGENSRTWAFIMSCLMFFIASTFLKIEDNNFELIGFSAISIILGKFFWVDTTKNSVKSLLKSFFALPYLTFYLYSHVIVSILILPVFKYTDVISIVIAVTIGTLSSYVITVIRYRKEFKKFIELYISKKFIKFVDSWYEKHLQKRRKKHLKKIVKKSLKKLTK